MSENEIKEIKEELNRITTFIPEGIMNKLWSWCNSIRGENIPQPCGCQSSAKHWAKCVEDLRKWINEVEQKG